ncbi:MAG: hypothetical protein QF903_13030 [Planctomycetota bacterium]|jgi:hypothetical protein|nr:hypothetical protein [Planctomycetota bacterium]
MHAYRSTRTLAALLLLALAACGGGGGQHPAPQPPPGEGDGGHPLPEPEAPAASIHFPPPLSRTDVDAIAVRGRAENLAEGGQLFVNGIAAQTDDAFGG